MIVLRIVLSTVIDLLILVFVYCVGVKVGRHQEYQIQQKISLEFEKIAFNGK